MTEIQKCHAKRDNSCQGGIREETPPIDCLLRMLVLGLHHRPPLAKINTNAPSLFLTADEWCVLLAGL